MAFKGDPVRVLVVPGLHGSGHAHWQTWLEAHFRNAVRVMQDDWGAADLARWSERVALTVARDPTARWVAVGHSFGCLALARYLGQGGQGIHAALLVAPADPEKFSAVPLLPQERLPVPSVLLGSDTDPWMRADNARAWARRWGSQFVNLGDVGHINTEAGFGPLPQAKTLVELLIHRVERARRVERAHPLEFSFAI
ncbi:MAG: serine hydrolase family protein [Cytophagales bacterium]|nr:serine hydrolase family protein [Rhizobacter sp.]